MKGRTAKSQPDGIKKDIQHGLLSSYTHRGCRCEECRQAMSDYYRERYVERTREKAAMAARIAELEAQLKVAVG